ncbi:uncharacterized protein LOC131073361 isoform X1 [Cryptomeria japonica]|uniref:uncharacterized protein LOC131073361 isoform X1 n=1 Tax=Cryptomeria japonica TaxID=3369 RepID=UPI0027DA14F4|nr:uncharacterized protein LOC131073361 isoform X1 [Cryptomeria japonica]XP_059068731.1 uncharacterized protein LOC131073361 isoform X1 [Cryptomeria japonica]XP_059068732.1 uncharacterized protein LOC131073361 isoform X1 [Cryptomeria japonica]
MILPPINEFEHSEGNYMKRSLHNLGETIQSLLGFKKDLTFTWAESVRVIIEGLSSATNSPDSTSTPTYLTYLEDAKLSHKENCDLEAAILKLEDELAALKAHLGQLDSKRREALNKLLDLKGSIRVFCRVKPFLLSDEQAYPGPLVVSDSDKLVIKLAGGKTREYNFDKVFLPGASQDEIFTEVEPIIKSALDGHNVCIFAYGQTGTGKTFTMEGKPDCPGIVPHTIQELFRHASQDRTVDFTFTFSMLEVYMGNVRDLLGSRTKKAADHMPKCLSIQMDAKGAVEIENLREFVIANASQASKLYRKGSRARSTSWTNANESSSRSHCLIRISISCSSSPDRNRDTSKLWMVDLGGSERLLKTQSTGHTMEEGKAINMSLSALGDVISALQKKQAHVPYRNSKLTQILRDSVGEDSRLLMLVHISPKEDDLPETICSLGFATRVRGIHLGWEQSPEVKVQKAATMAELMQQIKCLEDDCQSARNNIETVEFLLRQKKKYLAKSNTSSEDHETPKSPASQVTEIHSIELGNVAQGSVGLPRYMNSTSCSRIRGKSSDADTKYTTGFIKKREHLNGRRKSLLGSAKNVIFPEMDQSLCNSESTVSYNSVFRQSSLSVKKNLSRIYSKQYDFEESQCFSESSTPKDSGMLDDEKMNESYSEWSSFDGSQFLSGCNTPMNIGEYNNMKVNGTYSKPCTLDESKYMSECNMPKNIGEYKHLKMNGTYSIKKNLSRMYSKQCDLEELQLFSECSTPKDNEMLDSERMNGIYSECSNFDGSQFLLGCNTPKNILKVNGTHSKPCILDESKCMPECNMPKNIGEYNHLKMNGTYSIKKNLSRMYSKQHDLEELQFFSECSTPKDNEMLDSEKMNGIYSECSNFDGSQFLLGCNTPKNIGEYNNMKVNGTYSGPCTPEESKCMSECNMPKNIGKANNLKVNETISKLCTSDESNCSLECNYNMNRLMECEMGNKMKVSDTFPKKCIIDEPECLSERSMPESGLMSSLMPRCKRVLAFQSPYNETVNIDFWSNNITENSELTLIETFLCDQPINDKNEYNQSPSQGEQNSKQFSTQASLNPCLSMGEPMTCGRKIPIDMAAAAATTKMAETSLKKGKAATMAKTATGDVQAKPIWKSKKHIEYKIYFNRKALLDCVSSSTFQLGNLKQLN